MCGDDDDINQVDEEMFKRFLELAASAGVSVESENPESKLDLSSEKARNEYLEGLFKAGLTRAVNDATHIHPGERMDIIAGQAIAFARLSGFLSAQLPPDSDLFHSVVSALMQGSKEAARG